MSVHRRRPMLVGISRPLVRATGLLAFGVLLGSETGLAAEGIGAAQDLDPVLRDTLKGNAQLADIPDYRRSYLSLLPPSSGPTSVQPGTPACGPNLSSAAVVIGPRDQFAKAKGMGLGLLSKLASAATGGKLSAAPPSVGAQEKKPPLYEDPIKRKYRNEVKDKASGIKLDLGAQLARDGMLLSTRLDSVSGQGTVQEIYLERSDCRRIYPSADYTYELWGSWSLSVSWTRTESTYQDGKLINQSTTSGGFARSGSGLTTTGAGSVALGADFSKLPAEVVGAMSRYQAQIQEESGAPMWQRLGFAAPTSGARTVGNLFRLSQADLDAIQGGRMAAVVQVTRERGPFFEAVGVPVALAPGKESHLTFAALNAAAK